MKPIEPYPGRLQKWLCKCMHCGEVSYTYYSTVQRGSRGCKPCGNKLTAAKKRLSRKVVDEILAKAELQAVEEYSSTVKALLCECLNCGNYVAPTLADVKRGAKCEYCRGRKVDPSYAQGLAQNAGLKPLEEFRRASLPWKCVHLACGEIVYPHWTTLKSGGSGCMKCRRKKTSLVRKINDHEAISMMNKAGFETLEPYSNSVANWKSRCKICSNVSYPRLNNVKNGSRCIFCTNKGLSLTEPAFVYLISHPQLQAYKVGIGGQGAKFDRIAAHAKRGWTLFRLLKVDSGKSALEIERKILDFLFLECKLNHFLSAEQMPQGGHTETFDASEVDLVVVWSKIIEFSSVH